MQFTDFDEVGNAGETAKIGAEKEQPHSSEWGCSYWQMVLDKQWDEKMGNGTSTENASHLFGMRGVCYRVGDGFGVQVSSFA